MEAPAYACSAVYHAPMCYKLQEVMDMRVLYRRSHMTEVRIEAASPRKGKMKSLPTPNR
jgi:hypothetical protein